MRIDLTGQALNGIGGTSLEGSPFFKGSSHPVGKRVRKKDCEDQVISGWSGLSGGGDVLFSPSLPLRQTPLCRVGRLNLQRLLGVPQQGNRFR